MPFTDLATKLSARRDRLQRLLLFPLQLRLYLGLCNLIGQRQHESGGKAYNAKNYPNLTIWFILTPCPPEPPGRVYLSMSGTAAFMINIA